METYYDLATKGLKKITRRIAKGAGEDHDEHQGRDNEEKGGRNSKGLVHKLHKGIDYRRFIAGPTLNNSKKGS